ncbi:MAG: hypothetical protein WBG86_14965, partial [Polyangiales bacterium]
MQPLLTEQDKKELIAAIAKDCGYVIPADDPIFALVFLHNCVLGRTVEVLADHVKRDLVLELKRGLEEQVDDMGSKVAKRLYEELESLSEVIREVEDRVASEGRRALWAIVVV